MSFVTADLLTGFVGGTSRGEQTLFDRTIELAASFRASQADRKKRAVNRYWADAFDNGGPQVWHNAPTNLVSMVEAAKAGRSLPTVQTPLAPIIDQGHCGSCFAAATFTAMNMHMSLAAQRVEGSSDGGAVTLDYQDALRCLNHAKTFGEEGYDMYGMARLTIQLSFDGSSGKMGQLVPFKIEELEQELLQVFVDALIDKATAAGKTPPSADVVRESMPGLFLLSEKGGAFLVIFAHSELRAISDVVGVPVTLDDIADAIYVNRWISLEYVDPRSTESTSSSTSPAKNDPIREAAERAYVAMCSSQSGASGIKSDATLYGEGFVPREHDGKRYLDFIIEVENMLGRNVCEGGRMTEVLGQLWSWADPEVASPTFRLRSSASLGSRAPSFAGVTKLPDAGPSDPQISTVCAAGTPDLTDSYRLYRLGLGEAYRTSSISSQPFDSVPVVVRERPYDLTSAAEMEQVRLEVEAIMRYVDAGPVVAGIAACKDYSRRQPLDAINHEAPFPSTTDATCSCSFTANPNHAITVVGYYYDSSNIDGSYWVIQNSYGESWGFGGFYFLRMGHMSLQAVTAPLVRHVSETVNPLLPPPATDAVRLNIFDRQTPNLSTKEQVDAFLAAEPTTSRSRLTRASSSTLGIPSAIAFSPGDLHGIHFTGTDANCSPRLCMGPLPPLHFTKLVLRFAARATVSDGVALGATVARPDLSSASIVFAGLADRADQRRPTAEKTFSLSGTTWTRSIDVVRGSRYDTATLALDLATLGLASLKGDQWARLVIGTSADSSVTLNVVQMHLEADINALNPDDYYRAGTGDNTSDQRPAWLWPVVGGSVALYCCACLLALVCVGLVVRRRRGTATAQATAAQHGYGNIGQTQAHKDGANFYGDGPSAYPNNFIK